MERELNKLGIKQIDRWSSFRSADTKHHFNFYINNKFVSVCVIKYKDKDYYKYIVCCDFKTVYNGKSKEKCIEKVAELKNEKVVRKT